MTNQPRPVSRSDADAYLRRRVEAELRMAENATCAAAVKAHHELANLYLERLGDSGRQQAAGLEVGSSLSRTPADFRSRKWSERPS